MAGDEVGGRKASIAGQAGDFIGIELDLLETATGQAAVAGITEGRVAIQPSLTQGNCHKIQ
jgi:hypothetical protein